MSMERKYYDPFDLAPPHRITHLEHADELLVSILKNGWKGEPLVGYWWKGRIQLLSGTHRRLAAIRAHIAVPVVVYPYVDVENAWGTDQWANLMHPEEGQKQDIDTVQVTS